MAEMETQTQAAPTGLARHQQIALTVGSAVAVALAFQGMLMARNNYSLWRFEVMAFELGLALAGSLLANLVPGMDERGRQWAERYQSINARWLSYLLNILPGVLVRAALMTLCLSAVNATIVPISIYRETVDLPLLAVFIRFLADIPTATCLCLAVRCAVERIKK